MFMKKRPGTLAGYLFKINISKDTISLQPKDAVCRLKGGGSLSLSELASKFFFSCKIQALSGFSYGCRVILFNELSFFALSMLLSRRGEMGSKQRQSLCKLLHTTYCYNWIGHGLQSVPTLAFLLWQSDFKTKSSFGFLNKKIRGCLFFLRKVKKWDRMVKTDVLAILAKTWLFSDNIDMSANS